MALNLTARTVLVAFAFVTAAMFAPSIPFAQEQTAPEKPAQDQSEPRAAPNEDSIDKSIESLEDATERQMEAAKDAARDALKRIKAAYEDLKVKAAAEWEERRPEYERRMADAEQKVDELTKAAGEQWEKAKQSVAESLRDMSRWLDSHDGGKANDGAGNANGEPADEPKKI